MSGQRSEWLHGRQVETAVRDREKGGPFAALIPTRSVVRPTGFRQAAFGRWAAHVRGNGAVRGSLRPVPRPRTRILLHSRLAPHADGCTLPCACGPRPNAFEQTSIFRPSMGLRRRAFATNRASAPSTRRSRFRPKSGLRSSHRHTTRTVPQPLPKRPRKNAPKS